MGIRSSGDYDILITGPARLLNLKPGIISAGSHAPPFEGDYFIW